MKAIRVFALSALSILGLTVASAQAHDYDWRDAYYHTHRPPVVACAPVVRPVVVLPSLGYCPPVIRPAYYYPPAVYGPRVIYPYGCR